MNSKSRFSDVREYENLHVALWLVKDACWVLHWREIGMLMIIPTLFVAGHLTWKSRKNASDFFHNVAICFWIAANGTWMTGEFFYDDTLRPFAIVFFSMGISILASYYIISNFFKNRNKETIDLTSESVERAMNNDLQKVA